VVDNEGNIRGVNYGTVTITARSKDNGKVSATCIVTVVDPVTNLMLSDTMIKLMASENHQMTYTMVPASATVPRIAWTTSNVAIAKVDSFGVVTAIAEGECEIIASATDGSGVSARCTVVVTPYIPLTSITVNTVATTMLMGETRQLSTRGYPYNTTETVNWSSGDTSIVVVDNDGMVRAVGPGVTTVSVMGNTSRVSSTATITVLGLNDSSITIEQYDTYDLYLNGIQAGVTWFSRDKRIATVTAAGKVVARRPGTTTIVARVNGKMVSCTVTVETLQRLSLN
jgi:uncharacterized protein YjdB